MLHELTWEPVQNFPFFSSSLAYFRSREPVILGSKWVELKTPTVGDVARDFRSLLVVIYAGTLVDPRSPNFMLLSILSNIEVCCIL